MYAPNIIPSRERRGGQVLLKLWEHNQRVRARFEGKSRDEHTDYARYLEFVQMAVEAALLKADT